MTIEVRYNIGDEITWRVTQNSSRQEICSFCSGTGEVQGADNTILPCPKCNGIKQTPVKEYREGRSIVDSIYVSYDSNDKRGVMIVYGTSSGSINQNDVTGIIKSSSEIGN